ncbi:MAG TPA: CopG family transcriptional regulator [Tissierellales bacterium]|nr:CopG family transcriptional regulator [Tissierellales bacterium]
MNKRVTKHITVSKNLDTQLKYMAKRMDITESALIRIALIEYLNGKD